MTEQETEVLISVLSFEKTRPGGAFFSFLNKTVYDLSEYGIFKSVDKQNYHHNCLYLALGAGGLPDIKLQGLILTLRNRTIHKCDLSNVCNALGTNINLSSIRTDGKKSDVEHYPTSPHIKCDGTYNLGLVKNHYFINYYTGLTSFCLENCEEIKDLNGSNTICRKKEYYERDKTGKRFITSFHLFKVLMDNTDSLIAPMELTDDIMSTQFYDKTDDYKTLGYNQKNCRLEEFVEKAKDHYKLFFGFETSTNGVKHEPYLCWIYNDDIQQGFIGINTCAVDMLIGLPTDKKEILIIAHSSDYDCRFILGHLQNKRHIVKSNRFL